MVADGGESDRTMVGEHVKGYFWDYRRCPHCDIIFDLGYNGPPTVSFKVVVCNWHSHKDMFHRQEVFLAALALQGIKHSFRTSSQ